MNKRLGLALLLMCAVSGLHAAQPAGGSAPNSSWSETLRKGTKKFKESMGWYSNDNDLFDNIAFSGPIQPGYQLLLAKTYLLYRLGAWGYNKCCNNQQEDE